jgi:hypothetical protein
VRLRANAIHRAIADGITPLAGGHDAIARIKETLNE